MSRFVMLLIVPAFLVAAQADSATYTLGDQDFADGTLGSINAFEAASVGEPSPFDRFIGSDLVSNNPFTASFTFNYAPVSNITGGTLSFGMYDSDSAAPGFQVASFTLNGIDLTLPLNLIFEAKASPQSTNSVYSFVLPTSTFASLTGGAAAFTLTLQGPGLPLGLPGNGAALDFASLDITSGAAVPEPASWALMIAGMGGVGGALRRRSKVRVSYAV